MPRISKLCNNWELWQEIRVGQECFFLSVQKLEINQQKLEVHFLITNQKVFPNLPMFLYLYISDTATTLLKKTKLEAHIRLRLKDQSSQLQQQKLSNINEVVEFVYILFCLNFCFNTQTLCNENFYLQRGKFPVSVLF